MKLDFDVIIIGAGVSGMTAAMYLQRAGKKCCVIEKQSYGGQINLSPKVKNYPGFLEISGTDLSKKLYEQIMELNTTYLVDEVKKIEDLKDYKKVYLNNKELTSSFIIIASGRHPRKLEAINAREMVGKGLSYCATCDGNFFKNMDVCVIGGGSVALEEALYLSNICSKVYILNRSSRLRGEQIYIDKINKKKNVEVLFNTKILELKEKEGRLNSIIIDKEEKKEELFVKGCFTYIGYEPSTDYLDDIDLDKDGYVLVDNNCMTNIENIYAIGDIVNKSAFQLITAMNDGVIASTDIINKTK